MQALASVAYQIQQLSTQVIDLMALEFQMFDSINAKMRIPLEVCHDVYPHVALPLDCRSVESANFKFVTPSTNQSELSKP